MARTPCDCDTQVSAPCAKWMTLSEPLSSAISTFPSSVAAPWPFAHQADVMRPDADRVAAVRALPHRASAAQRTLSLSTMLSPCLTTAAMLIGGLEKACAVDEIDRPAIDLARSARTA